MLFKSLGMRIFAIIFACFLLTSTYCQEQNTDFKPDTIVYYTTDSVSGGNYELSLEQDVLKYLSARNKAKCKQNTPRTYTRPTTTVAKPEGPKTTYDICRNQAKVLGYKIQIFYSKSRDEANKVRQNFSRQFRGITPELVFARPDFKVLVGDYFTKKSAGQDLKKIKKKYPSSLLVSWRVYCRKAK